MPHAMLHAGMQSIAQKAFAQLMLQFICRKPFSSPCILGSWSVRRPQAQMNYASSSSGQSFSDSVLSVDEVVCDEEGVGEVVLLVVDVLSSPASTASPRTRSSSGHSSKSSSSH